MYREVWDGRALMITYSRTSYYGLGYLLLIRGSALPRCIPPAIVACAINYVAQRWPQWFGAGEDTDGHWLGHPYTFQLVGIVFGYLMVTRINMSYSRYWEGVTMIKQMHSKWADACGQIVSFDRALSTECNLTTDPFCCHIVRLFSQMSAMATMRLHIVDPGESLLFDAIEGKSPGRVRLPSLARSSHGLAANLPGSAGAASMGMGRTTRRGLSMKRVQAAPSEQHGPGPTLDASDAQSLGVVAEAAAKHAEHGHGVKNRSEKIAELAAGISKPERELLLAAPCPVFATAQRIQRAIITRLHAGGMRAPPPIISRIFQEVSNGLLFYNNATKMKEVPVPFPYVQLNAFLLNLFACFLCPIAIASFTPILWLSLTTTVVTVVSYFAVFIVANELEDPFGTELNDMPMLEFHEEFCASLCALMTKAWLPMDQWLVKEGRWIRPRNVALAANAFGDKIGKKGVAIAKRFDENFGSKPKPYSTLLNRAKLQRKGTRGLPSLFGMAKNSTGAAMAAMPSVVVPQDITQSAVVIQRHARERLQERKPTSEA